MRISLPSVRKEVIIICITAKKNLIEDITVFLNGSCIALLLQKLKFKFKIIKKKFTHSH